MNENPNAISRLRYNTMYVPKILQRIEASAPEGADLTSWRLSGGGAAGNFPLSREGAEQG